MVFQQNRIRWQHARLPAKAEHELQHLPEAGYVVKIEKHPADNDNK